MRLSLAIASFVALIVHGFVFYDQFFHRWERYQTAYFDQARTLSNNERERAALAYTEEATRHKRVSDATFETLRNHFNEREIVEITWVNALENYYNLINLPLEIESDGLCAIAESRTT